MTDNDDHWRRRWSWANTNNDAGAGSAVSRIGQGAGKLSLRRRMDPDVYASPSSDPRVVRYVTHDLGLDLEAVAALSEDDWLKIAQQYDEGLEELAYLDREKRRQP